MQRVGFIVLAAAGLLAATGLGAACFGTSDDCEDFNTCGGTTTTTATAGAGGGQAGAAGAATGGGGTGGSDPCGGACEEPTPLCDSATSSCVACLGHSDCNDPAQARCEEGACVGCQGAEECAHVTDAQVCDEGSCVECALGQESDCTGSATCDLVAKTCSGAEATTLLNCHPCTNDLQCAAGHRCIPMEFAGEPHGYYCLAEPAPTCSQPFGVAINAASISGVAATNYCGLEQDLATCEAVLALLSGWVCSGTDGTCGPDGQPEVAVPGAICRQVGLLANRCTYACAGAVQCPNIAPQNTCGEGDQSPPGWCGG